MLRLEKAHWDALLVAHNAGEDSRPEKHEHADFSQDLQNAGLRRRFSSAGASDSRTSLFRFASARALIVEVFSTSGVYLAMTNVCACAGAGSTTASGSGFTIEAAVLGCLGEAVEYSSWIVRKDDGDDMLHEVEHAGTTRISANQVLGFSAAQLSSRIRLNRVWDGWDRIPPLSEMERPQSWTRVCSFDERQSALCPTFLCYGQYGDLVADDVTLNVDSNGCAAGQTREAAKTNALLELIERDATGVWWHRGCVRQRLDIAGVEALLQGALDQYLEETGRRIWFLDISTFTNAATVAAVSCQPNGASLALGFSAAFTLHDAARSAFLELMQSEIAIEAHVVRSLDGRSRERMPADRWMARWNRFADMRNFPFIAGDGKQPITNATRSVEGLLDEIRHGCGNEVWFAELTRQEFTTPVFKAICERLGHYKLRRGSPRYADVPRTHGWQTTRPGAGRSDPFKLLI